MLLDEHPDQTKQLLKFWSLSRTQEGSNLDVSDMASGGNVRLMSDEHLTRDIADQVPAVTVGTARQLTSLLHASCSSYYQNRLGDSPQGCVKAYNGKLFGARFSISTMALMTCHSVPARGVITPVAAPAMTAMSGAVARTIKAAENAPEAAFL
jgi:hypothetical protein